MRRRNRPAWIDVPLQGLAHAGQAAADGAGMNDSRCVTGLPPSGLRSRRWRAGGTAIRSRCWVRTTTATGRVIRAFLPGARAVEALARARASRWPPCRRVHASRAVRRRNRRAAGPTCSASTGRRRRPGDRGPLFLSAAARAISISTCSTKGGISSSPRLGAQRRRPCDGVAGVRFAVWAPNARAVSVVGDFNTWDARRHPMRLRHPAGVWELFIPRLGVGRALQVRDSSGRWQAATERRSAGARGRTAAGHRFGRRRSDAVGWPDAAWQRARAGRRDRCAACRSTKCTPHRGFATPTDVVLDGWDELADALVPYVSEMGFTHVELMPVMRASVRRLLGLSAARPVRADAGLGSPGGFARFVDALPSRRDRRHRRLGAGAFSRPMRMAWRGSTAPRSTSITIRAKGYHHDWNTYVYNFGRREVQGFLIAQRSVLARAFPCRWAACRCGGRRCCTATTARREGRVDPEPLWRPREPRGDRFPAALSMRWSPSAVPGAMTDRRGIDRLAGRDAAACSEGGLGFTLQMEHGLDARHAALHGARAGASQLAPRRYDVRAALRVLRALRPAAVA